MALFIPCCSAKLGTLQNMFGQKIKISKPLQYAALTFVLAISLALLSASIYLGVQSSRYKPTECLLNGCVVADTKSIATMYCYQVNKTVDLKQKQDWCAHHKKGDTIVMYRNNTQIIWPHQRHNTIAIVLGIVAALGLFTALVIIMSETDSTSGSSTMHVVDTNPVHEGYNLIK